jgi:hypothetical protein
MKMKRIVVPRRPNAKTEMLTSIMPFSAWLEKPDEHRDAPGLDEVHRLEESIHSYARFVRPIKNKKRTLFAGKILKDAYGNPTFVNIFTIELE